MKRYLIYASLLLIVTGCTTVKVTKVQKGKEAEAKGVRYSLGKPFVKVTPSSNGDGTYTAEIVYLPDQDQTYAVQSTSYFAKSVMEITVDESGILKKIDWSGTDDGLASEATKAAANVAKADLENTKKENDERQKEEKDKKKAAEEAVKTLQTALDQKLIDKDVLENDIKSMKAAYTGPLDTDANKEKIRVAESTLFKLEKEIELLKTKLQAAQGQASSFNAPDALPGQTAYGPVFYSIVETTGKNPDLKLQAVTFKDNSKQQKFETVSKVEPAKVPAKTPTLKSTSFTQSYSEQGVAKIQLEFSTPIVAINKIQSTISSGEDHFSKIDVTSNDNKIFVFAFKKTDFPAGEYTVLLAYQYKSENGEDPDGTVSFKLKLE